MIAQFIVILGAERLKEIYPKPQTVCLPEKSANRG
jgi:hypothetical protein